MKLEELKDAWKLHGNVQVDENDCEDEPIEIWEDGYSDEALEGYEIVCWPDSQSLLCCDGFNEHCRLINDEEGYEIYGALAYVVEADWLKENLPNL